MARGSDGREVSREHRRDPGASPSPGRTQRYPGQRADPDPGADHPQYRVGPLRGVRRRLLRPGGHPQHRRSRRHGSRAADPRVRPGSPGTRAGVRDQPRRTASALPAAVAPPAGIHAGVRPGSHRDRARFRRLPDDGQPRFRASLLAADGKASPTPAASGDAGRPDAARSARATAGASTPAAASSAQATTGSAAPTPAPTPVQEVRAHTMTPASASAFRPHATGDDPENAHLAIDGRRGTAWRTDWYTTAQFGNLYSGTGLLVDMGRPVTVTGIRVTLGPAAGIAFPDPRGRPAEPGGAAAGGALGWAGRNRAARTEPSHARALCIGLVYQAAAGSRRNLPGRHLRNRGQGPPLTAALIAGAGPGET